jgi:hypothetical protein
VGESGRNLALEKGSDFLDGGRRTVELDELLETDPSFEFSILVPMWTASGKNLLLGDLVGRGNSVQIVIGIEELLVSDLEKAITVFVEQRLAALRV